MVIHKKTILIFLSHLSLYIYGMDNDIEHINKKIKTEDNATFKPYKTLTISDNRDISAIAFNHDAKKMACGIEEAIEYKTSTVYPGYIRIYDVETGKECNRIKPQGDGDVIALKFTGKVHNEALYIVTTSYNDEEYRAITLLEKWDTTTPYFQFKNSNPLDESPIIEALFNPDGTILAVLQHASRDEKKLHYTLYDTFYATAIKTVYLTGDYSFAYYLNNKDLVFKNRWYKALETIGSFPNKKIEGDISGEVCYNLNTKTTAHAEKDSITIQVNGQSKETLKMKFCSVAKIIFNDIGDFIACADLSNKIYILKKNK